MANNVFVCKWKKNDSHWQVWVKGRPKLCGRGETFDAARQQLEDAIWNNSKNIDDVIPTVMEYEPPLPVSERLKKFFTPQICMVFGDGRFELQLGGGFIHEKTDESEIKYVNSLYEKGICKTCGYGIGRRTKVEFKAEEYEGDYDGLWLFHPQVHANAYFFSDRFISLLTKEELERLQFHECRTKRKGKRKYFELTGNSIAASVGVKGFDAEGRECTECGHRHFYIAEAELDCPLQDFICRSDIPNPVPSCFAITINDQVTLCMTRERYNQIRGNKNAKGIVSELIGIVDENSCERRPRLQTSFRECEICTQWQNPGQQRFWKLPVCENNIGDHPSVVWLKKEIEKPETVTITRQEDTLDHIIEMAESGTKIKRSRTISFRCPKCWRLGQLLISYNQFGISW